MTQLLAPIARANVTRAWRTAFPARFDSTCALCGGVQKAGEPNMKYSYIGKDVYGHDVCPEVPQMPEAKPERNAPSADFAPILAHFAVAKGQYPKVRFMVGDDCLVMKFVRKTGVVNIVHRTETVWNDRFGDMPRWYGKINIDGTLTRSGQMTLTIEDELTGWATDFVGMARAYGKLTGECCFCGKDINTDESLAVGYGPECAKQRGLPWG